MHKLVEYFISRSLFVNVLTVLLILMGGYAAVTMNREAFPNIDFDIVSVTTVYPGASPEEVEKLITKPIEDAIKEVDGIKEVRSASLENRSGISVTLDPNNDDPQKAIDDIRSAVERVEDLPEDAEKPIITEIGTARQPIIQFYLGRIEKNGKYLVTEKELKTQARILEDKLADIKGVARITRQGYRKDEIHVDLDPRALSRYYISPQSVIEALQGRNINLPGGKIESRGRETIVRTVAEYNNVKEIENTVVRSNDIGQAVKIKSVARVREDFEEPVYLEKVNGMHAISLTVVKRESADAITVVDEAKKIVAKFAGDSDGTVRVVDYICQIQNNCPAVMKEKLKAKGQYAAKAGNKDAAIYIGNVNDFSYFIRRRLKVLISNGVTGLGLVILSLFVFLGWRTALMTTIGIPVALGMTFMAMNFMGVSLNLLSMFGLIVIIGIVVDDAIIVCENVYRHIEMGDRPVKQAVTEGAQEVVIPVLATISTTIAAFGPMLFVTGIFGKFIYFIPLVVILALLASLLESFFVLPAHLYDIQKNAKAVDKEKEFGWFDWIRVHAYVPSLKFALRHRILVTIGAVILLVVAFAAQGILGSFKLFPSAIDAMLVKITAPKGLTKDEVAKFTRAVEYEIMRLPKYELENFVTRIGIIQKDPNDPFTRRDSRYAMMVVYLTPEQERERSTQTVIEELREKTAWLVDPRFRKAPKGKKSKPAKTAGKKKGGVISSPLHAQQVVRTSADRKVDIPKQFRELEGKLVGLDFDKMQGGPPVGKPVAIQITGDDFDTLQKIAGDYKALLGKIKGVIDIDTDFEEGKDEMRFRIYEKRAAQAGVSVAQVALAINTAYQGTVATTIKRADEEVDIRVRFNERYRNSTRSWRSIYVRNRLGNLVPVSELATFERRSGITVINHRNGKRLLTVTANVLEEGPNKTTSQEANQKVAELGGEIIKKYPGYAVRFGGEYEDTQESLGSMARAFAVGIIIIFMILTSLFRSLIQPAVVVSAIPFAFIGVIAAFLAHGQPFSFLAFMGVVGLSGVVVNDSIVLVDFANRIRDENPHLSIDEIVLQAGQLRLRPVILTTVTTVLGLLPTAYGLGGFDPFLVPMALAFAWGLLFATALTLIFVPIQYKAAHQTKLFFSGKKKRQAAKQAEQARKEAEIDDTGAAAAALEDDSDDFKVSPEDDYEIGVDRDR